MVSICFFMSAVFAGCFDFLATVHSLQVSAAARVPRAARLLPHREQRDVLPPFKLIELHPPRPTQDCGSISIGNAQVRVVAVLHFGSAIVRSGSKSVIAVMSAARPLSPHEQTFASTHRTAPSCQERP